MQANEFNLSEEVASRLESVLGTRDVIVTHLTSATVPGLGLVHAVTASSAAAPNSATRIAVDEAGTVRSVAEVEAVAGRAVFSPAFVPGFERPPRTRTAVGIDPKSNEWTLSKCETARETIHVTVPPSGAAPKADVYLLADTTGSMSGILDAVKAGASSILNHPGLVGFDVAWGVGNYRDFPVGTGINSYALQHQLAPTTVRSDADAAISTWVADEGGDGPEGQLNALQLLATDASIGWRADAKKIVVWFGDAPGHDPICPSLTGYPSAITEASATAALVAATVTVVAVSTTTGFANALDDDPNGGVTDYDACTPAGAAGQATRITGATPGGVHVMGIDPDSIVTTLGDLIADAVASTGNVHLEATGDTAAFVTSISPAGGYGPLAGDTEHRLDFEVVFTGARACAEKPQVFTGTIDVVADGVVVASKPVTITVPACRYHHSVEFLCGAEKDRDAEECDTLSGGRYATMVTIYNPGTCTVVIEKRFAPLVVDGEAVGREPRTQPAKPFARIELGAGEAAMDDCCSIRDEFGGGTAFLAGVLDVVADAPLEVTVTHTVGAEGRGGAPSISSRTVTTRRAP
jgi:hypothetical protein